MASDLPEGFELDPAPTAQLPAQTVSGAPWTRTYVASQPPPDIAQTPAPASAGGLPPGFQLDEAPEKPGLVQGLVRSTAEGVPIIGPLATHLNAITQAAAAPLLPGDTTISHAPTFGERRAENLARERGITKGWEQEHPIVATVAGLAGGAAAGGALLKGAPTVGARLLGLTGQTLPGQIARGAVSGAGIGGLDAALRGNDPTAGALTGAALGAPAPVLGRVIGNVAGRVGEALAARDPAVQAGMQQAAESAIGGPARGAEPILADGRLTTEGLHQAASNGFGQLDNNGVLIHPDTIGKGISDITQDLERRNFRPEYQQGVWNILRNLERAAPQVPGTPPAPTWLGGGKPATFGDIMAGTAPGTKFTDLDRIARGPVKFGDLVAARQALNQMTKGIPTADSTAAQFAREGIDRMMDGLGQGDVLAGNAQQTIRTLNEANKNWSAYKVADMLEQALQRAELNAASGGSGRSNYANSLRQAVKPIINKINSGAIKVPADVEAALNRIVRGTAYGTRLLSKGAPTGAVSIGMEAGLGHLLGGGIPGTAAIMGVGHGAKVLQDRIVLGRMMDAIRTAHAHAPAVQRFGRLNPLPIAARSGKLGALARTAPAMAALRARTVTGQLGETEERP